MQMNKTVSLSQSTAGFHGCVAAIDGDHALKRKLMSLGIRRGQELEVLHHRKNGAVVLSKGSRVAIGTGIAAKVRLEPVSSGTGAEAKT